MPQFCTVLLGNFGPLDAHVSTRGDLMLADQVCQKHLLLHCPQLVTLPTATQ